MPKRWMTSTVLQSNKPEPDIHILPEGDLQPHMETRTCWCGPDVKSVEDTPTMLVVHHAADGRELIEEHGLQ